MGSYNGGHSKIYLSEDGTVWSQVSEREPHSRRWADDNIQVSSEEEHSRGPRHNYKEHKYRILAAYAESYRTRKPAKPLHRVPSSLYLKIQASGGAMEWINKNEKRLERFWKFVESRELR